MKTVRIAILFFIVFLSAGTARADHIPWIDKYGCCGEKNCLPATVSKRSEAGDIVINGVPLKMHPGTIHRSEMTYGWYCWRLIEQCIPPKDSTTVPQAIISEECAFCAFYEGRAGNF